MASEAEKSEVKEMIESFYKFANVPLNWNGEVNERVAEVFGVMLSETRKCSSAFIWIPTPPGGRATIAWLVIQLGRGIFNRYRQQLSFTCARGVIYIIYKWGRDLEMAALGLVVTRFPAWA